MEWIDSDEIADVQKYRADYSVLEKEIRRVLPNLSDEQILIVITLVVRTCPSCHEDGRGCCCTWDE